MSIQTSSLLLSSTWRLFVGGWDIALILRSCRKDQAALHAVTTHTTMVGVRPHNSKLSCTSISVSNSMTLTILNILSEDVYQDTSTTVLRNKCFCGILEKIMPQGRNLWEGASGCQIQRWSPKNLGGARFRIAPQEIQNPIFESQTYGPERRHYISVTTSPLGEETLTRYRDGGWGAHDA